MALWKNACRMCVVLSPARHLEGSANISNEMIAFGSCPSSFRRDSAGTNYLPGFLSLDSQAKTFLRRFSSHDSSSKNPKDPFAKVSQPRFIHWNAFGTLDLHFFVVARWIHCFEHISNASSLT